MRTLHIWACGLGEELGWLGKVGRDRLSSLGDACLNSHQIGGFGARRGGVKTSWFLTSLFQFFTLARVGGGDGRCAVISALRIVCQRRRKEAA